MNRNYFYRTLNEAKTDVRGQHVDTITTDKGTFDVYKPSTKEQQMRLGANTRWEISRRNDNTFDKYFNELKDRFYIFINKETQEKYQLELHSNNTKDVYNAMDNGIGCDKFKRLTGIDCRDYKWSVTTESMKESIKSIIKEAMSEVLESYLHEAKTDVKGQYVDTITTDKGTFEVYKPSTKEQMMQLGKNTGWELQSRNRNEFDRYFNELRDRFYIFIKNNDEKYQLTVHADGKKDVYDSIDNGIGCDRFKRLTGIDCRDYK